MKTYKYCMKNISMVSAQTLLILHIQSPIIAMLVAFCIQRNNFDKYFLKIIDDDDDDCLGKLDEERDGLDK